MNQVIQGDCLEVMATLPDNSIDLICTDPPYFGVKGGGDKGRFEWWDRQWEKPTEFLKWIDQLAAQWQRILKPNGSLYCFASPRMAARVEVTLGERFAVLNHIRWVKEAGWHQKADKEISRQFHSPWEAVLFCEHYGADNIAKGEAGYGAKCDELRGFVFEPLRAYLDGERQRAGFSVRGVAEAFQQKTGSRTVTGMAGHWFTSVQWTLPTEENYLWLRRLFNGDGDEYLRREYEDLRREYEDLRREYEDLRRPFSVTADVPYTDVWTFPTVQAYRGKHPCEKPAAMLEHIITASSRSDAVVLDCFAGSGSTLVAAKKLGRQYIGIEIDPHWCDVARGKLGETQSFVTLEQRVAWLETQVQAQGAKLRKIEATQQLSLWESAS
jgi:site-specific DNA-methyltransferase (adenine-specific)